MAQPLRFVNVSIDHPSARDRADGAVSQIKLFLATPGGQGRDVPLDEDQALKIIQQLSGHLITLRKRG